MSITAYPTLRLKLTMPQALKLQFLPAIPGSNATAAADRAEQAAQDAQNAANTAVAATANKVDRTGDVMTGFLTLNADPTAVLHAATKQYVDSHSGGAPTTAEYITASVDATLSAERVLTNTATVTWDFTTPGQAKATAVGSGGAPVGAEYITSTADATLTAERVLTDSATITWDRTTVGQIKANTAAGGGNVSNSGTPALDQVGVWVTATTIKGIGGTANQVLRCTGTTPSFGAIDLSQAAAVTGDLALSNLAQGTARSLLGVTGNATADYAPIQGTADQVPVINGAGTALAFGTVATGGITNAAVTYAKMQNVSAASLLIGRGSAAGAGVPQEITLGTNLAMSGTTLNATGGGTATPAPPQGRLTLLTGVAVMVTSQVSKTTIYYTPYVGNQIPIYDGTNMVMTAFTELSVATTDTTKSPAALGAGKVNDWFVWNDASTIRIGHGPDWTSDTARSAGTALVRVNGIWLNNASITNGPAASRGTYVGTTRSDGSGQLNWIPTASGSGGSIAYLWLWNAYNRVRVVASSSDTKASWTYNSTTWRVADNSSNNSIVYVDGLEETDVDAFYLVGTTTAAAAGGGAQVGVNRDSTSATPAFQGFGFRTSGTQLATNMSIDVRTPFVPSLGAHTLYAMENCYATDVMTFYGSGWGGGAGQTQYLMVSLIM